MHSFIIIRAPHYINKNHTRPYPCHQKPYQKKPYPQTLTQKSLYKQTVAQKSVPEKPYLEIRSPKIHTQKSEAPKIHLTKTIPRNLPASSRLKYGEILPHHDVRFLPGHLRLKRTAAVPRIGNPSWLDTVLSRG